MTINPHNTRREGNTKSGWCSAAPGARIPHRGCRFELCSCECHDKREDAA